MTLARSVDAPLTALNTFGIASRARELVEVTDAADLPAALALAAGARRSLVLGGGSNLLLTGDIDGVVVRIATRGRRVVERDGRAGLVEAAAGEPWDPFVRWTLAQGLSGLENLALIPGTAGASPIQNIGAYGVELCDRLAEVVAIHRDTGERRRFDRTACRFGYRDSVFKQPEGARWVVETVRLSLSTRFEPVLGYGELGAAFKARDAGSLTATEVADAVAGIRRRKLPDPARLGNAGSFFKNPVVEAAFAESLAASVPGLPVYPAGPLRKLSAAWMIDRCGWRGVRRGDAGVHAEHALVLVNHGNATGAQILALAREIQDSVLQRFGVALSPEPTIFPAE